MPPMLGPIPFPVSRPREPCKTQACVESRRQGDEIALWAIAIVVIGAIALALVLRARLRRRARLAARKQQAAHDRAQDDLEALLAPKDEK